MAEVLLLNADYQPHSIISWKDAIVLMLTEKARVVESYDDWSVRSPSLTIKVPSVLVLLKYVVFRQEVKFSRANIYARDEYQCQYCGKKAGLRGKLRVTDLTFDHVIPRSKGGDTSWENIVTSCQPCNGKKAARTPREAGLSLLKEPVKPKTVSNVMFTLSRKNIPKAWRDYLYWHQDLSETKEPNGE